MEMNLQNNPNRLLYYTLRNKIGPDRSRPVQGFECAVWTGPDRPEKFNDGPVRSMNLPNRCISDEM